MSEENNDTPRADETVAAPAEAGNTAEAQADAVEWFEVHGKKFDLSTPQGKGELKGFLEAMSSELGRKNNEVGSLRKFAAAVKPDADESKIISQARAKAQEGDLDAALDSVFSYSKAKINEVERKAQVERDNNETWDSYLASRPELTKLFDKKTIRKVSETDLAIFDADDPFAVLDSFWLPKTKMFSEAKPTASMSQEAVKTPSKKDVPPAMPTGGQARTAMSAAAKPSAPESVTDLLAVMDEASRPKRRSK